VATIREGIPLHQSTADTSRRTYAETVVAIVIKLLTRVWEIITGRKARRRTVPPSL